MKSFLKEFILRGLVAASGGPIVLAIIYYIIGVTGEASSFAPNEVTLGIISVTVMAFIAAGITAIYKTERLPLISAILIHAAVLYLDYLLMYSVNSWIPKNLESIATFTIIFALGFAAVWCIIYATIKIKANKINKKLSR